MAETPRQQDGPDNSPAQHPDLLAAVVLHTLVGAGDRGMTADWVARACERDPANPAEVAEVQRALAILIADHLAERNDRLFRATRAALRAAELSF